MPVPPLAALAYWASSSVASFIASPTIYGATVVVVAMAALFQAGPEPPSFTTPSNFPPQPWDPTPRPPFHEGPRAKHPPLDKAKRQIRLLSVYEHRNGELACELSVVDLSSKPHFIALSYTWGPPDVEHLITLNGHSFSVRENLFLALKSILNHLKAREADNPVNADVYMHSEVGERHVSPECWKHFWIDAICIDQEEVSEKNHQVQMMSDIYKSASFVIVWLGLEYESAIRKEFWHELRDSNYWMRTWVVQEFILARHIVLASGSALFHLKNGELKNLGSYSDRSSDEFAQTLLSERRLHVNSQQNGHRQGLIGLVHRFRSTQCEDPRDRIFAMYGLCNQGLQDQSQDIFRVNYKLSPAQLLNRSLRAYLKDVTPTPDWALFINSAAEALDVQLADLVTEDSYLGKKEWEFLKPFRGRGERWYSSGDQTVRNSMSVARRS